MPDLLLGSGGHLAFKINDLDRNFWTFLPSTPSLIPSQKKKATTNLERRPGRLFYFLVSQEQQCDTRPAESGTPVCAQQWARQDSRRVRFSTRHRQRQLFTNIRWPLRYHKQTKSIMFSIGVVLVQGHQYSRVKGHH